MPLRHHWLITKALIRKELLTEWRQKYALSGVLLYVMTTVFLLYFLFDKVGPESWAALFWVTVLFAAINAVAKSFMQESSGRMLYFYSIAGPAHFLLAKMLYNLLLLLVISLLTIGAFALLLGTPLEQVDQWAVISLIGSGGFAFTFTTISAIAAKAQNNATLMAILGFPVVLPQLALLTDSARTLILTGDLSRAQDSLLALGAVDVIVVIVSFLLFPYLWRE
jgi:heme exporter protein B